ncbi:hypothetical protein BpHYR1_001575 [Brachionus plicatilis]|uniref:Uncharacterized protein n=1 Tax=Brachionus plicatilis TaxID=10195 RepID=A0A3M7PX13_BRAPC|nr:hypothetical protein BpHYR1_001575 [Brachionus plicatilis]
MVSEFKGLNQVTSSGQQKVRKIKKYYISITLPRYMLLWRSYGEFYPINLLKSTKVKKIEMEGNFLPTIGFKRILCNIRFSTSLGTIDAILYTAKLIRFFIILFCPLESNFTQPKQLIKIKIKLINKFRIYHVAKRMD